MSDIEKSEGKAASSRHESDASPEVGGYHHDLLYDPDAHLSPEERAKVVSVDSEWLSLSPSRMLTYREILGPRSGMASRLDSHSLGKCGADAQSVTGHWVMIEG